jgi:hypothetical protein
VETGDPDIANGDIGLVSNPCVWAHVTTEPGTSAMAYCAFVEHVLNTYTSIENPALCRTLIHDNLTSHKAPEIYNARGSTGTMLFVVRHTSRRMDQWNMPSIRSAGVW